VLFVLNSFLVNQVETFSQVVDGPFSLDTQDPSPYTPAQKKRVIISKSTQPLIKGPNPNEQI